MLRYSIALAVLSVTSPASAAIFATAHPGTLHVIIDVCPDNIISAVDAADKSVTRILTDEFWTSSESLWLFHMNEVGSLHHFDLTVNMTGLSPDVYEFNGQAERGYTYTNVYDHGRTSEYRTLAVVATASVIPEPSSVVLAFFAIASFSLLFPTRRV
jgi:hypothetical protein